MLTTGTVSVVLTVSMVLTASAVLRCRSAGGSDPFAPGLDPQLPGGGAELHDSAGQAGQVLPDPRGDPVQPGQTALRPVHRQTHLLKA